MSYKPLGVSKANDFIGVSQCYEIENRQRNDRAMGEPQRV
jgi:hypothetical protein